MKHWQGVLAIVSLMLLAGALGACRPNRPYMPGRGTSSGAAAERYPEGSITDMENLSEVLLPGMPASQAPTQTTGAVLLPTAGGAPTMPS